MPETLRTAAAVLLAIAGGMLAQSTAVRPSFAEFEAASIKPSLPGTAGRWIRMQSAHEFTAKNHALKTLIAAAYNLNPKAISGGPAWVDSEHFDIVAKAPSAARPNLDEQMTMLRRLLADRFQLSFHREQRELHVYELTVAKGGPKLKESTVSPDATPEGAPPLISTWSSHRTRPYLAASLEGLPMIRPSLTLLMRFRSNSACDCRRQGDQWRRW
jgi:uncharacterized protein (TIGR03435 family)